MTGPTVDARTISRPCAIGVDQTCTAEVSFGRRPFRSTSLRSRKRPARTPPSTFLFLLIHLSNNPETVADLRPPIRRRNRRNSKHPTVIGGLFTGISEELRRRDLTPRRRRAVGPVYRLGRLTLSTPQEAENSRPCGRTSRCLDMGAQYRGRHRARIPVRRKIASGGGRLPPNHRTIFFRLFMPPTGVGAALRPHSSGVLEPVGVAPAEAPVDSLWMELSLRR